MYSLVAQEIENRSVIVHTDVCLPAFVCISQTLPVTEQNACIGSLCERGVKVTCDGHYAQGHFAQAL